MKSVAKPKKGYVYVLTHDGMPGVVKIGMTTKSVRDRLKQINGYFGNAPDLPIFEVAFYASCRDPSVSESKMHRRFDVARVDSQKELFCVDLNIVREALGKLVGPVTEPKDMQSDWVIRPMKKGRVAGGFSIYCWLRDNYDELISSIDKPEFCWSQIAYRIALETADGGKPFRPLAPIVIRQIWERAEMAQRNYGWNPYGVGNAGTDRPKIVAGSASQPKREGEIFSTLSLDAGELPSVDGGIHDARPSMDGES